MMTGFKIDVKNEYSKLTNTIKMIMVYIILLIWGNVCFKEFGIKTEFLKLAFMLIPIALLSWFIFCSEKNRLIKIAFFSIAFIGIIWIYNEKLIDGLNPYIDNYSKLCSVFSREKVLTEVQDNGAFGVLRQCFFLWRQ